MPLCPECHKHPLPAPFKDMFPALRCYECGLRWLREHQRGFKEKA